MDVSVTHSSPSNTRPKSTPLVIIESKDRSVFFFLFCLSSIPIFLCHHNRFDRTSPVKRVASICDPTEKIIFGTHNPVLKRQDGTAPFSHLFSQIDTYIPGIFSYYSRWKKEREREKIYGEKERKK